jgi:hypothetical protein
MRSRNGTREQAAERELLLYAVRVFRSAAIENVLHAIPQLLGDDWLVRAGIRDTIEIEVAV